MAASNERIREVVAAYVSLIAEGTGAEIVDLLAEGRHRTTRAEIAELYRSLESLVQETRLLDCRIAADLELAGGRAVTVAPSVMVR